MNVRVGGLLKDFIAANVGAAGTDENVSEYVRDLIRPDEERVETARLASLKAELTSAVAAPGPAYKSLDADMVIARSTRA